MKRAIAAILLALTALLCACGQGAPPAATEAATSAPEETSLTDEKNDDLEWYEGWYDSEFSPTSDDPMAFCNLFPDPFFARVVAGVFGKTATDTTTYEELAAYDGGIECYPGVLKSIEGIGLLTGLTSFICYKNDLETLPEEIGNLMNLTEINLHKAYGLRSLPPEIGQLKKLTSLRVNATQLEALPKEIGDCEALECLFASNTPIISVPPEIGKLKKLRVLTLSGTGITDLPNSLCELTSLEELYLSFTDLTALPEDIGNLQNLRLLRLFGCKLKTLPRSMRQLKNLRHLNVYDNFELDESYKKWFDKKVYS